MGSICVSMLKRFIVLTAFIFAVAGCGSSGSNSSATNSGTGSLAAKLIWSSPESKTTSKTLYSAPVGVDIVKIVVLAGNIGLVSKDFSANANSGRIDGIPAGTGYTVKVQGLVSGSLIYERVVSNVTVNPGSVTDLGFITMASITTATELPVFGVYSTKYVTLTASTTPATIYYTTNGKEPVFGNASTSFGPSPINNIFIKKQPVGSSFLKFFSRNNLGAQELTKIKEYIFP